MKMYLNFDRFIRERAQARTLWCECALVVPLVFFTFFFVIIAIPNATCDAHIGAHTNRAVR